MITNVYVIASNAGDGSVSVRFFENLEVADWHEEHDNEGWAEPSVRTLEIESESPIMIPKLITAFQYYIDHIINDEYEYAAEFKEKFGSLFPEYTLENGEQHGKYKYVNVIVDGKIYHHVFVLETETLEEIRNKIDSS